MPQVNEFSWLILLFKFFYLFLIIISVFNFFSNLNFSSNNFKTIFKFNLFF